MKSYIRKLNLSACTFAAVLPMLVSCGQQSESDVASGNFPRFYRLAVLPTRGFAQVSPEITVTKMWLETQCMTSDGSGITTKYRDRIIPVEFVPSNGRFELATKNTTVLQFVYNIFGNLKHCGVQLRVEGTVDSHYVWGTKTLAGDFWNMDEATLTSLPSRVNADVQNGLKLVKITSKSYSLLGVE